MKRKIVYFKRSFLLCFVFLMICSLANSQTDPTNYIQTDKIGVSPNASSLGRIAENPINLYTGLPHIQIPIYTLQGKHLTLPISLNYHFSGFKPNQPSSWVGLGWTLEAGGIITRNVRDKIDEEGSAAGTFDTITNILNLANSDWDFMNKAVSLGMIDTEPDLFSYSFPGYTGHFVYYRGKAHLLPNKKLRIQGNPSIGFTITTPEGTQYIFQEIEQTTPKGGSGASYNLSTFNSAWHLSRIKDASLSEEIVFTYTSEGQISQHGVVSQTYKHVHPLQSDNAGDHQQFNNLFNKASNFPTFLTPKRLVSIVMGESTVLFSPSSSARLDIDQGLSGSSRSLHKIHVSNQSQTIREYEFFLRYTPSSGFNGRLMFLDSLKQNSLSSGDLPQVHKFEYAEIFGFSTKTGAAVDHYGYYLGAGDFGSNIMPSGLVPAGIINRDPQLLGTQGGALIRMIYPTGGNMELEYELNRRFDGYNYEQIPVHVNTNISGSPLPSQVIPSADVHFHVPKAQNVNIHLIRGAPNPFIDNHARNLSSDFRILQDDLGLLIPIYYGQIDLESDNPGRDFTVFLQQGDYYITTFIDERENYMEAIVSTFSDGDPLPGALSGGLRVLQSKLNPIVGSSLIYNYRYTDELGFSSGAQGVPLSYTQREYTDHVAEALGNYFRTIHSTIYNSVIGEFYGVGIPHFYTSVYEEQIALPIKIRTRYEYESYQSEGTFLGVEPVRMTQFQQKEVGLWQPVMKKELKYLVKTDTIIHAIKPYLRSRVIEAGGLYPPPQNTYAYEPLMIYKQWMATQEERNVSYFESDSLVQVRHFHYDVNGYRNLQVVREIDSRGGEKVIRYKYPEDYSSALSASFLSTHVLAPAWEQQVWRKTSPTDSVLVSGTITEFNSSFLPVSTYTLNTSIPLTAPNNQIVSGGKFSTLMSDTRYGLHSTYEYDALGRIRMQRTLNDAPESFIWNSSGTAVMAHVKGAIGLDIAYTSFEDEAKGNWVYTGFASVDASSPTGKRSYNLSGGNVTKSGLDPGKKYILQYWAKSASAGSISGGIATNMKSKGSWTLYQRVFTGLNSVTLTGAVIIDDLRLFPYESVFRSFTYDLGEEISTITDSSGDILYYEYDGFGRLRFIRDDQGNVVESYHYHVSPI